MRCESLGEASPEILERLRMGIELEDGVASFKVIVDGGGEGTNHWYRGCFVGGAQPRGETHVRGRWPDGQPLDARVRYGPVHLSPRLKRGQCRDLEPAEVQELLKLLPPLQKSGSPRKPDSPPTTTTKANSISTPAAIELDSAEETGRLRL